MRGPLSTLAAKLGRHRLRPTLVSLVIVLFSHSALVMVPFHFPSTSLIAMLPIAGFVMVFTYALVGWFRRILGITASAPAMVIGHILFLWAVHLAVIHEAISSIMDVSLNAECVLLLLGIYRIFSGDPGLVSSKSTSYGTNLCPEPVSIELFYSGTFVQTDSTEFDLPTKSSLFSRVRRCSYCKRSVMGFDHHCPAFGNCIGQRNHHLFMILVLLFILTEGTYTLCSSQYIKVSSGEHRVNFERIFPGNLVISTLLFSFLQILWQVPFLTWHIYCICSNIKTDEWANWRKYSEFQLVSQPQTANSFTVTEFVNPYNKGILSNIREYLTPSLHYKTLIV